jgi:hypothetical protein
MDEATLIRRVAVESFNKVWELLEKPQRSTEEDDAMLHGAHASRYLWGLVGEPVNLVRGEWQVSRVNSVLMRQEAARYHAQRSLDICLANGIGDFDLAYAYEALARAYAIAGDTTQRENFYQLALQAGQLISDADDKKLFDTDLKSVP